MKERGEINLYKNYRSAATPKYPNEGMKYDGKIQITFFDPNIAQAAGDRPEIISSENIKVNGRDAIRKITSFGTDRTLSYMLNLSDKANMSIYLYENNNAGTVEINKDTLDKILQTFKFTN